MDKRIRELHNDSILDEAAVHPTEDELGELFRELEPGALSTVLSWLPRLTNERVRALLYAAATRLAQAYPDQLVEALPIAHHISNRISARMSAKMAHSTCRLRRALTGPESSS